MLSHSSVGLLACAFLLRAAAGATFYVSPDGVPGAPGTIEHPLPSLAAARDAIRELRRKAPTGPVTVLLRGGTYRLAETLILGPEDSDVTYEAYPHERPILSGSRRIEGWQKAAGPLWTAPVTGDFRQLFVNGRRALRARTPTNGFYRIDGLSSQDKPFLLKFRGDDIRKSWAGRGDVEVIALLAWSEIRMPIAQVDEAAHTARLTGDPRPSNKEKDARYWIENAPDALDSPGEWYLDRAAHTVSYWPAPGENLAHDLAEAPALLQLVRVEGKPESGAVVRNVVFRRLNFRHADSAMPAGGYADVQAATEAPTAFEAMGAEGLTIEHCVFTQSGGYAVWFGRGSHRNRIVATEIFDMGGGGVKIGELVVGAPEPSRASKTPSPTTTSTISGWSTHPPWACWWARAAATPSPTTIFTTCFTPPSRSAGRGATPPTSAPAISWSTTTCITSAKTCSVTWARFTRWVCNPAR